MRSERNTRRWTIARTTCIMSAVLVLYVLSSGPWVWVNMALVQNGPSYSGWLWHQIGLIYLPLDWVVHNGPEPIGRALGWYWWAFGFGLQGING